MRALRAKLRNGSFVARMERSAQADRTMRDGGLLQGTGGRYKAQSPDCADIAYDDAVQKGVYACLTRAMRLHPGYERLAHG